MIPPAYYATFGPKMGLRAMTIPRSISFVAIAYGADLASDGGPQLSSPAQMSSLAWDGYLSIFDCLSQVYGQLYCWRTSY